MDELTKVIPTASNDQLVLAHFNRGLAFANLAEYVKALEDFTTCLAKDKFFLPAYNGAGACYLDMGQTAEAEHCFRLCIEIADRIDARESETKRVAQLNLERIKSG